MRQTFQTFENRNMMVQVHLQILPKSAFFQDQMLFIIAQGLVFKY